MRKLFTLVTMTFSLSIIVNFSNAQCIKTSCNGSSNTGTYSSAIGYQTNSTGNYAFSSGYKSAASGISTTALGDSSIAGGNFSFAAGCRSVTTKFKSVALGENCLTKEVQSYAIGQNCITNASQSLAIGRYMQTNASGAIALGSSTSQGPLVNGINNSLMIGFNSTVPTLFVGPSPSYNSSGNVGINTTSPTQKLDIDGNIRLRNNATIGTWSSNSLTFNTNSAARMVILADGKVGVGTKPATMFHVAGDVTISTLANPGLNKIVAPDATGKLILVSAEALADNLGNHTATQSLNMGSFCIHNNAKGDKNTRDDGSEYCVGLKFDEDNSMILETGKQASFSVVASNNSTSELWVTNWTSGGYGLKLNADNKTGGIYRDNNNPGVVLGFNNTKVGVNVIPPADGQYSFYVKGGILAEEVKVMLQSNWPDYVFKPDYQLPSLPQVESFIQNNGHLPGMPNAQSVKTDGINLGEMNAVLLKKIEELTLYMIDLQKNNEQISSEIENLKTLVSSTKNQ